MKFLTISPTAHNDLLDIWKYIAEDSPGNATLFLQKMHAKCLTLVDHPHSGKSRSELMQDLRSIPIGNYLIFYRNRAAGPEIIRVLHAARDIQNFF